MDSSELPLENVDLKKARIAFGECGFEESLWAGNLIGWKAPS